MLDGKAAMIGVVRAVARILLWWVVLVSSCVAGEDGEPGARQGGIRWKVASGGSFERSAEAAAMVQFSGERSHFVVHSGQKRSSEQWAAWGVRLLGEAPEDGVLVSVAESDRNWLDLPDLQAVRLILAAEKWSPAWEELGEGWQEAIVEFFPDVTEAEAREVLGQWGSGVRREGSGPFRVSGALADLRRLVLWDAVSYVFPAPAASDWESGEWHSCAMLRESGADWIGQMVASVGEGWDGPGQGSADLGYVVGTAPGVLTGEEWAGAIERALEKWRSAAALRFRRSEQTGAAQTLEVLGMSGEHGDGHPFDGPRGTIAHTFYPTWPEPRAGDVHLDSAEPWRVGADTDAFSVLLHELGHALGLGHADEPGSVMYPYYGRHEDLGGADVAAIRRLYAEGSAPSAGLRLQRSAPLGREVEIAGDVLQVSGVVSGGAGPYRVRLAVGGRVSEVLSSGSFVVELVVVGSPENVNLGVEDAAGAAAAESFVVRRRTSAPVLVTVSPVGTVANPLRLTGRAEHSSGISGVRWTRGAQNGVAEGTESWTIPALALDPGWNRITVSALARDGSSGVAVVEIRWDAPPDQTRPSLVITEPATGSVATSSARLMIRGRATDASGIRRVWMVLRNATVAAAGTESWSVEAALLVGINPVTIYAEDTYGNVAWRSVTVTRR